MGHEKICVITSVLEDQQTLRFIVFCTLEKLCVTPMYRFRVSRRPVKRLADKPAKIIESQKRILLSQTTATFHHIQCSSAAKTR